MAQLSAECFEVGFDRYLYVIAAVMGSVCRQVANHESGMTMNTLPKANRVEATV